MVRNLGRFVEREISLRIGDEVYHGHVGVTNHNYTRDFLIALGATQEELRNFPERTHNNQYIYICPQGSQTIRRTGRNRVILKNKELVMLGI